MSIAFSRVLCSAIAAFGAAGAMAGEITLFEYPDFAGRRITLRGVVSNFDPNGFNDRAASMVIRDGYWELCSEAYFRGRCATFGPGEYRTLQPALTDTISSAREVGGAPAPLPPPLEARPPAPGFVESAPRIELWERREFGGRSIVLTSGAPDFERIGFNDRADAAVVYAGVWRLCEHAGLGGQCREFGPGRYNDLGYLGGKVSSAAIAGGFGGGGLISPQPPPGRARAILYEYPNFGGGSFIIEANVVANLDRTGFNDRASSIRVEGGYWLFCTDAGFEGTCRTFGPGDYASLPWEINDRISSGRRIHDQYPYNAAPAWNVPR
ncbi:MAG: beta/gamma crystallin-related protein [Betaproteobacteria bacterium]